MPRVSVIVPNYNHAIYLKQRIDSVLNQTYQDFELILLDDCSTDNSREVLMSYKNNPKVSHIAFNEENSGSTFKQWDKGVELASGEYIWIAESDDWAEKGLLMTLMNEFDNRSTVGLAYVASRLVDKDGVITDPVDYNNTGQIFQYTGPEFIEKKLTSFPSIWNASMMMFKKSVYPVSSYSDKFMSMKYCGDWLFYIMVSEKVDVVEIKTVLNNFRIHVGNVSSLPERSGATFIESLKVFSYIKRNMSLIKRFHISYSWARKLNDFNKKYHFNIQTNFKIFIILLFKHQFILLRYIFMKKKLTKLSF